MQKLSQPPRGSCIQIEQTGQQIHVRLPDDKLLYGLAAGLTAGLGLLAVQKGLDVVRTEPSWTGAALVYWAIALGCLTIAGLLLVSRPTYYIDPPTKDGEFRFQWTVTEIVLEHQRMRLRLFTPFRHHWVQIPLSEILYIERINEKHRVLMRPYHHRMGMIHTSDRDYMIGSRLLPAEQEWLVAELSTVVRQLKDANG